MPSTAYNINILMELLSWNEHRLQKLLAHDYQLFIGPWCGGSFAPFQPDHRVWRLTVTCVVLLQRSSVAASVLIPGQVCRATWAQRNWLGTFQNGRPGHTLATSPRRSSRSRWWCCRGRMRSRCRRLEEDESSVSGRSAHFFTEFSQATA